VSVGVLLALLEDEPEVVRAIDRPGSGGTVVRRCADLAELLGAAGAGIGQVAVLSSQVLGVDRASVGRLVGTGAAVLLVGPTADLARLGNLGAHETLAESEPAETIATTAIALGRTAAPTDPARTPTHTAGHAPTGTRAPASSHAPTAARTSSSPPTPAAPSVPLDDPRGPDGTGPVDVLTGGDVVVADEDGLISAVPRWLAVPPDAPPPTAGDPPATGDPVPPSASEPAPEEQEPSGVVVVWGAPGAPGRTTLAVNIAAEAAALGVRTIVVDADTEAPSMAQVLGISEDVSSIAALARMATHGTLDEETTAGALTEVADHLRVLTGLTRPQRWRELEAASLDAIWDHLREQAALVVIDVGAGAEDGDGLDFAPVRHQATLSALRAADHVVAVGAGDPVGIRRLVLALTELRERGLSPDADRTVVVNRVRRSAAGPDHAGAIREALWRYAGDETPHLVPDAPALADRALLAGTTWREADAQSPARRAVVSLARHLLGLGPADDDATPRWRRALRVGSRGRG
jgi:MinD-like ATPase involved in chromosome partitioning or flagellar assembly